VVAVPDLDFIILAAVQDDFRQSLALLDGSDQGVDLLFAAKFALGSPNFLKVHATLSLQDQRGCNSLNI